MTMPVPTVFHRWACAALVLIAAPAAAQHLQLPAEPKALERPGAEALGTREAGLGLAPGTRVEDFRIESYDGAPVAFGTLRERGPLLVVFYRGGWCPYCNYQIRELARDYPKFEALGVTPVLISVDRAEGSALVKRSYEIPFPVLSDPELKAHRAFDVVLELTAQQLARYKAHGLDLAAWSGRGHRSIAVSSAFVVDEAGTVRWAHVAKDFKTRPSNEQLLAVAAEHAGTR